MKIAVMGAGAVGGYFGGVLAHCAEDVSLIVRGSHLQAIREHGLTVGSHWGSFTVDAVATDQPAEVGEVDLVLYCVKLYSNPEALPTMAPLIGPRTTILTIQNGVTSGEAIAAVYGRERVLQGATYIEAEIEAPGHIAQSGSTARIEFGEDDGARSERVDAIEEMLHQPGIQVEVSDDIASTLWTKLVSVGAIGTVMTAARSTLSQVLEGSEGKGTIRTVMEEIVAVGQSRGVKFQTGVVEQKLQAGIAEAQEFRSSLQFDLNNGKPLELDELLGAVVRMAHEAGIPVAASIALVMTLDRFRHGSQ